MLVSSSNSSRLRIVECVPARTKHTLRMWLTSSQAQVSIKTTLLRAALLARLSMHTAATVMRRMSSTEAPTERAPPAGLFLRPPRD